MKEKGKENVESCGGSRFAPLQEDDETQLAQASEIISDSPCSRDWYFESI